MGFSPFFLVYSSEAILPTDVVFSVPHIQHTTKEKQNRHIESTSTASKNVEWRQ
jgi:hypothetical protein